MNKFWRIALHEYTRHVFRRRFLFALLSVPFFILAIIGLIFLILMIETDTTPVGYVDHSGLLADPLPPPPPEEPERPVPMVAFQDEATAQNALEADEIQAYYVLEAGYLQTGQARLVYFERPKDAARGQFYAFLRVNLLAGLSPQVSQRVNQGTELVIRTLDESRQTSEKDWFNILIPMFTGIVFVVAIFTSSGYLLQAVVEEKENRTMEIMVTSVSPGQLMSGKVAGDIGVGLTQLLAWIAFLMVGVRVGGSYVEWVQRIEIPWAALLPTILVMLPAFVMVAALMAMIGATVTEAREGQQMVGFISLPMWIPYVLIATLIENPNSPLSVGLSLFPLTAPLAMALRAGFTVIPAWQIAVSASLLVLSALGAIWLAGRALRIGLLRYGQRLRWSEIFARRRG